MRDNKIIKITMFKIKYNKMMKIINNKYKIMMMTMMNKYNNKKHKKKIFKTKILKIKILKMKITKIIKMKQNNKFPNLLKNKKIIISQKSHKNNKNKLNN